MNTQRKTGKRP